MRRLRWTRRPVARLTILVYNETYVSIPAHITNCPVDHVITFDRSHLDDADAVLFHIPTLESNFRVHKRPGQCWVALSAESDVICLRLRDRRFMAQFDFTMTYRLDSDFPMPYIWPDMVDRLLAPPWDSVKSGHAVCFISGSSNLSFRDEYVTELMRHMPVDSFGRVLCNRTLPEDAGRRTKLETIARYPFTLAFENSIAGDYVTEKFYDPLLVGSVPVYLGAPNVDRFAPADHCYINVTDFSGPEELATYLLWLRDNPDAYSEYLAWKGRPLREGFLRMATEQHMHPVGRVCVYLAGERASGGRDAGRRL